MGTKNDPGEYDCYANAKDDEPMFVLLARDPIAPVLVHLWVMMRGLMGKMNPEKDIEAQNCAAEMKRWKLRNPDV